MSSYSLEALSLNFENGGFYAAALHLTLNLRYTLIGKLGWGIHSSVWLVWDSRCVFVSRISVRVSFRLYTHRVNNGRHSYM